MSTDKHGWNHPMCDRCWVNRRGVRIPHRLLGASPGTCCFCCGYTTSGIYVREDPSIPEHCTDRVGQ